MTASTDPVRIAALRLKNVDPRLFAEFISALEVWVGGLMLAMTTAKAEDVFLYQGQARAGTAILRILNECHLKRPEKPGAP